MKISIVTASYNYENYIKETIKSVLNQTYQDWELIIIDDCSSDNSVNVIKSFQDDRIKLFVNKQNLGLAKTLKLGIEKATGDWIVFLESDDLITSDYLAKKVQIIQKHKNINLIFNDCEFFGDTDRVNDFNTALRKTRLNNSQREYPSNMFYNLYLSNKIFTFSAVMAKRNDLLKLDFNTPIDSLLDWWLWIQLAYIGKFYYIQDKLTKWRLHKKSYITKSKNSTPYELQIKAYFKLFKKNNDIKILLFIPFAQIIWYLLQIKKNVKKLIINKRK